MALPDIRCDSLITKSPEASSGTSLLSSQTDKGESKRIGLESLSNCGEGSHGGLTLLSDRGEGSHGGQASLSGTGEKSGAGRSSSSSVINLQQLKGRKHKKKMLIKTLDKKLKVLENYIKKYSEAEVSMDEMKSGSSAYMKEDLYKRKFLATWKERCDLLHECDRIELAEKEGSSMYSGTCHPKINRRVQRLLKLDEFPDHFDILELVDRCNSKYELGISADEKSQLSRQIFNDIGKLLKARRHQDYISHFGCHLTDCGKAENDPALFDDTLLQQLLVSVEEGKTKMEQVCEEFVTKQEQECDSSKSTEETSYNSDEEEEEEEMCEEINTIDTEDGTGGDENQELDVVKDSCEPENEPVSITSDQNNTDDILEGCNELTSNSEHGQTENIEAESHKNITTSDQDKDIQEDDNNHLPVLKRARIESTSPTEVTSTKKPRLESRSPTEVILPKKDRIESTLPTEVTLPSTTADSLSKTLPTSSLETTHDTLVMQTKDYIICVSDTDSDGDVIFISSQ